MRRVVEGPGRGIGRRQFLVFGLASAASPWLTDWGRTATLWAAEADAERASVGYLVGSEHLARVDRLPWLVAGDGEPAGAWAVVPSGSLPVGEPVLAARGLRVRVHGLLGGDAAPAGLPRVAELDVLVEPADAAEDAAPLVFHAWRMERHGDRVEQSPPVSFDLLVDHEDGLVLSLRVVDEAPALRRMFSGATSRPVARQHTVRFGLEGGTGPKLLRGIYLLGLRPGSYDGLRMLDPASLPGEAEAAALVLSIDSTTMDEE